MSQVLVLWKREMQATFFSPMAYVVMAVFLVLMGLSFSIVVQLLVRGAPGSDVVQILFASPFFWLAVLIAVPSITMRLLTEERREGTIESLMTAPVTCSELVIAKFLGALSFYLILWIPTLSYVLIIHHFSASETVFDVGGLAGAYLGAGLIGAFFISVGLFFSSLTSSQIVAAISTFAAVAVFLLVGFLPWMSDSHLLQELTRMISGHVHMNDFARGAIHTQVLVFYLSTTLLMLFVTVKYLQSRDWQ